MLRLLDVVVLAVGIVVSEIAVDLVLLLVLVWFGGYIPDTTLGDVMWCRSEIVVTELDDGNSVL